MLGPQFVERSLQVFAGQRRAMSSDDVSMFENDRHTIGEPQALHLPKAFVRLDAGFGGNRGIDLGSSCWAELDHFRRRCLAGSFGLLGKAHKRANVVGNRFATDKRSDPATKLQQTFGDETRECLVGRRSADLKQLADFALGEKAITKPIALRQRRPQAIVELLVDGVPLEPCIDRAVWFVAHRGNLTRSDTVAKPLYRFVYPDASRINPTVSGTAEMHRVARPVMLLFSRSCTIRADTQ